MQHALEKFLFISLFGIFLISFPVYLSSSEADHTSILTSQVGGGHLIERVSSEQNHQSEGSGRFRLFAGHQKA
jgi:hypothetical protein